LHIKEKIGYDPLNYAWVEKKLPNNKLEQNWFKFQRETKGSFADDWKAATAKFQKDYNQFIEEQEAFDLTRKWKRYIIGAWNTILSQNNNIEDWEKAAIEFEKYHTEIEQRMKKWTQENETSFPIVKTKAPIRFRPGQYFNQFIERAPKLFTNSYCSNIKQGIPLLVTSYDPQLKYIRLDFTPDIRNLIKKDDNNLNPWKNIKADYIIYVPPEEVDNCLEKIESF